MKSVSAGDPRGPVSPLVSRSAATVPSPFTARWLVMSAPGCLAAWAIRRARASLTAASTVRATSGGVPAPPSARCRQKAVSCSWRVTRSAPTWVWTCCWAR